MNGENIAAGELDLYDDKVQQGIAWALRQVGEAVGLKTWVAGDGSESVEGDVGAEIITILSDAGLYDPENGTFATLNPPTCSTPAQGYGAGRLQPLGHWSIYAVGGDPMGIGLRAETDAACDMALSALRIQRLIEALRADEGDCVTICSDNPEEYRSDHRIAVDCNGAWTNWEDRRFFGATVVECLTKALLAREAKE